MAPRSSAQWGAAPHSRAEALRAGRTGPYKPHSSSSFFPVELVHRQVVVALQLNLQPLALSLQSAHTHLWAMHG